MIKKLLIGIIEFYQIHISCHLGRNCRFYPSCSEYSKRAIDKYGIIKGIFKSFKRILKCSPINDGGYDPLK